jgi:hypothetical protein
MTIKKAVAPVSPAVAAAAAASGALPGIPATWQDAFNFLADRLLKVIGRQAATIDELKTGLEDAHSRITTSNKAHGDLSTKFDDLVIIRETVGKIVAGDDARDDVISTIQDAVKALVDGRKEDQQAVGELTDTIGKSVADLTEETRGRFKAIDAHNVETDQQIQAAGARAEVIERRVTAVEAFGERLDLAGEADRAAGVRAEVIERRVTAVEAFGERLDDIAGNVAAVMKTGAGLRDDLEVVRVGVEQAQEQAAKQFTIAMEAVDGEAAARGTGLDEIRLTVRLLDEGTQKALTVASQAVDELAEKVKAAGARAIEACDATEAVTERVTAVEAFGGRIDDIAGTVTTLDGARAEMVERLDAVVVAERETAATARACTSAQAELSIRVGDLAERGEGFDAAVARVGVEMKALTASVATGLAAVSGTDQQAAEMLRRVTILMDQTPSAMMIDKDGELVRVARNGESVKIGKVTAVNGRNGRDAADIVAARIEGDRLIFTRSDRTEFGCAVTVPPAPPPPTVAEVDPTKLGHLSKDDKIRAVQVADMMVMRDGGARYKQIADKYEISERQAARLIKGVKDDDSSATVG